MSDTNEILSRLDAVVARSMGAGLRDATNGGDALQAITHADLPENDRATMLAQQAGTLDRLFGALVQRAAAAQHFEQTSAILQLALRCQAQSVRTVEAMSHTRMPDSLTLVQVNHGTTSRKTN